MSITISLPPNATVVGELLLNYQGRPERLSQDILQVTLANGYIIDVGWYPRFDPNGRFRVVVCHDNFDNCIRKVELREPASVAMFVDQLAEYYSTTSRPVAAGSCVPCQYCPAEGERAILETDLILIAQCVKYTLPSENIDDRLRRFASVIVRELMYCRVEVHHTRGPFDVPDGETGGGDGR